MKKQPPNILFLMSDEHRYDVSGFAGNQVIRTPNLDWLSETGMTFTNAYTPSPVCIPARQSLMSGQFPRTCGCEVYGEDLEPGYMTFSIATLCDLTNTPVPEGLDSRSMLPLLDGRLSLEWDNESISQYGGRNLMIKRDHLKYQSYGDEMAEVLFDLKRNPEETINYGDDSKYAKEMALFRNRRMELGF